MRKTLASLALSVGLITTVAPAVGAASDCSKEWLLQKEYCIAHHDLQRLEAALSPKEREVLTVMVTAKMASVYIKEQISMLLLGEGELSDGTDVRNLSRWARKFRIAQEMYEHWRMLETVGHAWNELRGESKEKIVRALLAREKLEYSADRLGWTQEL